MTSILVIEDNKANLELVTYLLEYKGYHILTAMDGKEGVNLAKQERPNLIICDILLPKLSGYEIAKILKNDELLKKIPLVAVTAYAMAGDGDKIHNAGFDAYIAKPIDPERFVVQIESLLPSKLRLSK